MVHPCPPRILKEFSHHLVERSSLSGERQLGWWTGNPGGALVAPPTGPLEIALSCLLPQEPLSTSFPWNAESIALLAQQCTLKPQRSHANVQSWKVLFSSARDQYRVLVYKLSRNWLVGEIIETGGIHTAGEPSWRWAFAYWCLQLEFKVKTDVFVQRAMGPWKRLPQQIVSSLSWGTFFKKNL